jgi:hypothetical protein
VSADLPELPSWLQFLPGDLELYQAYGTEGLERKGLHAYVVFLQKDTLEGLELLGKHYAASKNLPDRSVGAVLRGLLLSMLKLEDLPVPETLEPPSRTH